MGKFARLPVSEGALGSAVATIRRIPRARPRYFAFLSYSHKDEELAEWLHNELEEFRVPAALAGKLTVNGITPKRLTPIFRDEHELAAADDLGEEIEEALSSSQFLIVLCSPNAAKSHWTNVEIEAFKRTRPDGCVLAAIAAGEPFASEMPGREDEECFPPALRQKYDRRGRPTGKRAEPLAADLREEGDGRRMGFLKLVAGMLGVGLDDLVQRETTRRHRRLAWLAAGSLAGMAVTSGLAITAIQARDAARDQRREAEGLVAFMVGDLKDKLEPIGKLDALDGVGSRVLAYYSKQDTSELSDAALLQRSRALSITAQVAYLRGNYDGAARLYNEAMGGTAEAIRRNPNDPQRLFDHAQNVYWVGELARRRGEIGQAESSFLQYADLARRMVGIEPNNLKWRMEVQYANENLGIVRMTQRRFSEAANNFQSLVRPMESLTAIDPRNAEYQSELSNALGWLADSQAAMGRFDSAIGIRTRQVAYLDRVVGVGDADVALQQQVIPARQALGVLFTFRGDVERGIEQYRMALARANRLMAIEPNNSIWSDEAAHVQFELARNLLALNRREEAAADTAAACVAAANLRSRGPNVARWRTLQITCFEMRSRVALASGMNAQALNFGEQALSAARSERSGDPVADRYTVAEAYRLVGDVRRSMGDLDGARAAWSNALAAIPANAVERPLEMDEHAIILTRLGRSTEAKPLVSTLGSMGYRHLSRE
jgi:eukaryotic-like serine/threonine-protein kinase